jgi:hypothetical protein
VTGYIQDIYKRLLNTQLDTPAIQALQQHDSSSRKRNQ